MIEQGNFNNKIIKLCILFEHYFFKNYFMNIHSFLKTRNNEQVMNNSWTSFDKEVARSELIIMKWPSYEQIVTRLWTSYEQVIKKWKQVMGL